MRSLVIRFGVATIACLVGIVATTVLSNIQSSRSDDQCCHDALVAVERDHHLPESWPKAPARISVSEVQRSYDLSEVDITFNVQSLNGKSKASFEVWAVKSHNKVVYEYKRILVHSMRKDNTGLSLAAKEYTETVCVSLDRGFFRKRIDNVQLYLESVEFSDGTTWSLPLGM
ncbi:MAG TPA: hypothetical protein VGQ39_15550 [Pyrinomonadaceae bacterium]|nr:hypothetical protein [Pyrinomonadaceae bacterium]